MPPSLLALAILAATPGLSAQVKALTASKDFEKARQVVEAARPSPPTPAWLEAYSWLARGELAAELPAALADARKVRAVAEELLAGRELDAEPALPIALGAAIEVEAQARARAGLRLEAREFLDEQLARYRGTSISRRIQKNLNLLTLVGQPAPALEATGAVGPAKAPTLASLRGRPVLLYFWAHWCSTCKQVAPAIASVRRRFAGQGLAVLTPTQLYGTREKGQPASEAEELAHAQAVRETSYPGLADAPAPVSAAAFERYGVSTTPTIVVVDRTGTVTAYIPGTVDEARLARLVTEAATR